MILFESINHIESIIITFDITYYLKINLYNLNLPFNFLNNFHQKTFIKFQDMCFKYKSQILYQSSLMM